MFKRLKQHWNVNNRQLVLILTTFTITGTSIAWLSKNIPGWFNIENNGIIAWILKLSIFLFGYQVLILVVGFCFGMFRFFWEYEKKILKRMGFYHKSQNKVVSIAIFASGKGSNAQKIIDHFNTPGQQKKNSHVHVALIVSNNEGAGVLQIARDNKVSSLVIEKGRFNADGYVSELEKHNINFIVLAGFMWKIPTILINAFPNRIINIHPALLPKYGGKKMYGDHVHHEVLKGGEKESGITIHYVDEIYDHGAVIFQASCLVDDHETVTTLAGKIHALEHEHYPKIIERLVLPGT
ncbi:MAG: phosphoribosylglycinamide formyltransferase [Ginsengibacter sp.]